VADGNLLPFRRSSFDLVYSISVLEHVQNVGIFLQEMGRVLRPGGYMYSIFGPLWFTHCGPHIGSLGYDHLLLSPVDFLTRVREIGEPWQIRWAEDDFYNRLTLQGYLQLFERHFTVRRLAVVGCPGGLRFRKTNPEDWERLVEEHGEPALLTRLASVIAQRRPEAL
jgi:SAM-dependent methyltransferase